MVFHEHIESIDRVGKNDAGISDERFHGWTVTDTPQSFPARHSLPCVFLTGPSGRHCPKNPVQNSHTVQPTCGTLLIPGDWPVG